MRQSLNSILRTIFILFSQKNILRAEIKLIQMAVFPEELGSSGLFFHHVHQQHISKHKLSHVGNTTMLISLVHFKEGFFENFWARYRYGQIFPFPLEE